MQLAGGETVEAVRTQQMQGEGQLAGAEYSDPVAVQEQLIHGGSLVDRMMHLWQIQLLADLAAGEQTATDVYGRTSTETLTFTVAGFIAPGKELQKTLSLKTTQNVRGRG